MNLSAAGAIIVDLFFPSSSGRFNPLVSFLVCTSSSPMLCLAQCAIGWTWPLEPYLRRRSLSSRAATVFLRPCSGHQSDRRTIGNPLLPLVHAVVGHSAGGPPAKLAGAHGSVVGFPSENSSYRLFLPITILATDTDGGVQCSVKVHRVDLTKNLTTRSKNHTIQNVGLRFHGRSDWSERPNRFERLDSNRTVVRTSDRVGLSQESRGASGSAARALKIGSSRLCPPRPNRFYGLPSTPKPEASPPWYASTAVHLRVAAPWTSRSVARRRTPSGQPQALAVGYLSCRAQSAKPR